MNSMVVVKTEKDTVQLIERIDEIPEGSQGLLLNPYDNELWLNFADGSKCKYDPQAVEKLQKIRNILYGSNIFPDLRKVLLEIMEGKKEND